jgi:hypothetical protein
VWPDWANFHLLGGRLLLAVFSKITEVAQLFWTMYFFPRYIHINFGKKRFGYILGKNVHKLILSPCTQASRSKCYDHNLRRFSPTFLQILFFLKADFYYHFSVSQKNVTMTSGPAGVG